MKSLGRVLCAVGVAVLAASPAQADPGSTRAPGSPSLGAARTSGADRTLGKDLQIVRDVYGVPHVFAETDEGAYFGAGFAAAEDRLFQMTWQRLMIQGRLAWFFGPGEEDVHLRQDRRARYLGYDRRARQAMEELWAEHPRTAGLLQAYADGVNAYMAHPDFKPHPFFNQYKIPFEPWEASDSIGAWIRFARHFMGFDGEALGEGLRLREFEETVADIGLAAAVESKVPTRVFDDSAAVVQRHEVPPSVQDAMFEYAERHGLSDAGVVPYPHITPKFSHAWVVGETRSSTVGSIVHASPQTIIHSPSTFYEWHMRGETFNVRGAGVAGSPNIICGSTPYVAWGATGLGMDQADLFKLAVDPVDHPGEYFLDGEWIPWEEETEYIFIRGRQPERIHIRTTYWGPVVTPLVDGALEGEQYAVKSVPLMPGLPDSSKGFVDLIRTRNVEDFAVALGGWNFPSANVVFGDWRGGTGYWCNGAAPLRSNHSPLGGRIAQDGSSRIYDWQDIIPHELMPSVLNPKSQAIFSANHMPVGEWYPLPLALGTGSLGDTMRSKRIRERLSNRLTYTPEQVRRIQHDAVDVLGRDLSTLAVFLRNGGYTLSAEALHATDLAEGWIEAGALATANHEGSYMISQLDRSFRQSDPLVEPLLEVYGAAENGFLNFLKTKTKAIGDGLDPEFEPAEIRLIDMRMSRAWTVATHRAGSPKQWVAAYETDILNPQFPTWQSLENLPSLDDKEAPPAQLYCAYPGTLLSQLRQGYSQNVAVGEVSGAQSILPFGQTERGPHRYDQQDLYLTGDYKPSPFTRAGVNALGVESIRSLSY